jgi:hypothetical protein
MNNFVFVGQFVSKEDSLKDKRISQAGNNYQLKFVELLNPCLTITLLPIFIDIKGISKNPFNDNVKIIAHTLGKGIINYIYRFVIDSLSTVFVIKRSKITNIFFYNLDKQNSTIIFIVKFLLKCKVYIIVADFSTYKNKSNFDKFCNWLLSKINGVIVFNSNIKVNYNQRISPGLISENEIVFPHKHNLNKNVIMSGSLGATNGLEIVLNAFKRKSDWNLYITGRLYRYTENEFNSLIQDCHQYKNIHYMGLLSYEQYLNILDKCDITISLRNPNDLEHQYNFPSKILEYLSKSKLVISSILYDDLPKEFLFHSDFNPIALNKVLDKISSLDSDYINKLKLDIYNYLKMNYTQSSLLSICNALISINK